MRAAWTALALFSLCLFRAQGQVHDINLPSPDGKWIVEAKWHPDHPLGYTWEMKNIVTGKVFLADSASKQDEILPVRLSGLWSPDSRYLALNIYYGRIVFGIGVVYLTKDQAQSIDIPHAEEKSMILPSDRKRWDGSGGPNSSAFSWSNDDTLTVSDGMIAQLANPDGTMTRIDSSRDRTIRFTGKVGKVISADTPQY